MDPNASVTIVWTLAAMEASETGWDEIDPRHFLCAALRFAGLDSDDLEHLALLGGKKEEIQASHDRVVEELADRWSVQVPTTSTALRRALRQKGSSDVKGDRGMLHRSSASRELFRRAQQVADDVPVGGFDVVHLLTAILAQPDEEIRKAFDAQGLGCGDDAAGAEDPEHWGDIVQRMEKDGSLGEEALQRIRSDPTVKVVEDLVSENAKDNERPCLLVSTGQKTGREVLQDMVHIRKDKPSGVRVYYVRSRRLLEAIAAEDSTQASDVLKGIAAQTDRRCVFYFDSLHRYFSQAAGGKDSTDRFRTWLRKTDGRFLFGISEQHYHDLIDDRPEWKGVFHVLWIHDDQNVKTFDL